MRLGGGEALLMWGRELLPQGRCIPPMRSAAGAGKNWHWQPPPRDAVDGGRRYIGSSLLLRALQLLCIFNAPRAVLHRLSAAALAFGWHAFVMPSCVYLVDSLFIEL